MHDAKKEKMDEGDAWKRIKEHKQVVIAKGKKMLEFIPTEDNKQEILKQAMGRSGNLRAPSLSVDETLLIGFNEIIYERFHK